MVSAWDDWSKGVENSTRCNSVIVFKDIRQMEADAEIGHIGKASNMKHHHGYPSARIVVPGEKQT